MFPIENFRKQFPILDQPLKDDKKLIYFDNSATTQKPKCVIDTITNFYSSYNSNVYRGMYEFSERATCEFEQARTKLAKFFGVANPNEIIFVRGTTEAINLVAASYGRKFLKSGDEILIGEAEHHANYLPWQVLEQEIGIVRKIIPLDENYRIDIEKYKSLFSSRTKFVAIQHISNVLGTVNDIKLLTKIAHACGSKILIDGACAMAMDRINLNDVDCDFFACSGHKGFGPMGSGFLFGKYELLSMMPPYHTGGNIVNKVSFEKTSYKLPPVKFEAGTPDVSAVIGLGKTIDFLEQIDWKSANLHLKDLTEYGYSALQCVPNIKLYGHPQTCIFSFNINGIHSHDIATILGNQGIAVRAGNHCAQPLMYTLNTSGTVRLSMCLYNTRSEIDAVIKILQDLQTAFA